RGMPAADILAKVSARFPGVIVGGLPAAEKPAPKPPADPAAPKPAGEQPAAAAAPAPQPAAAPLPAEPPKEKTVAEKIAAAGPEYVLDLAVKREDYLPLIRFVKEDAELSLNFLIELTAVDWKDRFEVIVHLM